MIAFRFLAFIYFVLWHIDNLVTYTSVAFLTLVIALSSYAFRSRTIIDWSMVVLFLVLSVGIVWVFAQADRDAVLSRITGTQEGKLDRHFYTHLISYGGVPALVLLATHFPTVGRFFFSWVKPALEAIHEKACCGLFGRAVRVRFRYAYQPPHFPADVRRCNEPRCNASRSRPGTAQAHLAE